MPGIYRRKNCPYCGVEHRNRGPYCSKSHAGLDRSPEIYEKVSDFMKYTEKGQALTAQLINQGFDELPVVGGRVESRVSGFVSDGDLWLTDSGDW